MNLDSSAGEIILLGGKIIEIAPNALEIVVLQLPLGRGDRPRDVDESEGRFLIRSEQPLDPTIYQEGKILTVVGEVIGIESRFIGDLNYVYPVIKPIEIGLWSGRKWYHPYFHFSIEASGGL
jgi:outer membrane lipoprotein